MPSQKVFSQLLDDAQRNQRFITRMAVRVDVWIELFRSRDLVKTLLTPIRDVSPGALCVRVNKTIGHRDDLPWCIYNESVVCGDFDHETLITCVLPLSLWWQESIQPNLENSLTRRSANSELSLKILKDWAEHQLRSGYPMEFLWAIRVLGIVADPQIQSQERIPSERDQLRNAARILRSAYEIYPDQVKPLLFAVSRNRPAELCLLHSTRTVKADAARKLFSIDCEQITWAVLDSGIDQRNQAFKNDDGSSCVRGAYDFTEIGTLLDLASSPDEEDRLELQENFGLTASVARKLRANISSGKPVDWSSIESALEIGDGSKEYLTTSTRMELQLPVSLVRVECRMKKVKECVQRFLFWIACLENKARGS